MLNIPEILKKLSETFKSHSTKPINTSKQANKNWIKVRAGFFTSKIRETSFSTFNNKNFHHKFGKGTYIDYLFCKYLVFQIASKKGNWFPSSHLQEFFHPPPFFSKFFRFPLNIQCSLPCPHGAKWSLRTK